MTSTEQPDQALCDHIRTGAWPLRTELVLDDHLGATDAVVSCRECGRPYLMEMLDWRGHLRVMRMSVLDATQAARLIRDLTRGSCDVSRAGQEVYAFKSQASFSPWLLLLDNAAMSLLAIVPVPAGRSLPGAAWRALPCDGSWVDYARSYTDKVKA
jgi:hypothetical protein